VPLRSDFQLDVQGMIEKFSDKTRLLYICSPNNPTSNQMKAEDIEKLSKAFPGIVLLDEAYGEFADYSFVHRIREFPNMVILRTFSKASFNMLRRLRCKPRIGKVLLKRPFALPSERFTIRMG
jgi:histidinol-phosphate aminotransferase